MVNSLVDLLNPPGVVPLQRVVETFDGDTLDERWTFTDIAGTGSGAMNTGENGGYRITTGTSTVNSSVLHFNEINHYSNTGSVFIATHQQIESTLYFHFLGLEEGPVGDTYAMVNNDTNNTFIELTTKLNGSTTNVASSTAIHQNLVKSRIELKSSSCTLHANDILEAISTTNLPDVALEPHFRQGTRTTAARNGDILYMECYNT